MGAGLAIATRAQRARQFRNLSKRFNGRRESSLRSRLILHTKVLPRLLPLPFPFFFCCCCFLPPPPPPLAVAARAVAALAAALRCAACSARVTTFKKME